ncbi:hypothetical protein SAMN05443667_110129 [Flavobacterium gillisiae]|uniref:Pectate lyase superfamily protein n=1 Tax=Flavobacterium gillisiae TaxID=150146 RepID=A0A1H4EQV9_9FLAO|nr:hypothetical protein [Flavobacterium gillisiae]SEA87287.1 hypothetical protein SAMN05443667_110129 [Flavobacterium gillisiae]
MVNKYILFFFLFLSQIAVNAQSIIVLNDFTNENIKYHLVRHWEDGTIMNEGKVDGVIYIKKNNYYYKRNYDTNLYSSWFGTIPNDTLDDADSMQAAINYAIKTSQNLIVPSGRYYIDKTIIIPKHFHYSMKNVKLDFSNATLLIRNDITVFQSDNWDSKVDSRMSNGIILGNFEILSENGDTNSYALKIQDYHQGSKIENISSFNVKNLLHSKNNFYLELYNINSNYNGRAGKRFLFEGYHALNKFTKLTATNSDVCYSFEGGMVAAIDMSNISIEGCAVGINFSSEVYNLHLHSSYFENFETALVFSNYIHSAKVENNYVNFLNNESSYFLQYKGLPANNITFNSGNTYLGTSMKNLVKNKEDIYGDGIVFEFNKLEDKSIQMMQLKMGKNIKINK